MSVSTALGSLKELVSLCAHTRRAKVSVHPTNSYLSHVKAFIEEGSDKFEPLLAAMQQYFGVGRLNMEVAQYIFHTDHIATIAGPFRLFGAEKSLQMCGSIAEICKADLPESLQHTLPAVGIGSDGNGTNFYVFLSDEIVLEQGKPPVVVPGLGGRVLSVPENQFSKVAQEAAKDCQTLDEFLAKLDVDGCGLSISQLVRLQVELYSIGILHSPCDTQEQMWVTKQKVCDVLFDGSAARLDKEVYLLPRYEFVQTLLDV